jgi:hypothetical protein
MEQSSMEETRLAGVVDPNQVKKSLEESHTIENAQKVDGVHSPPLDAIPEDESKPDLNPYVADIDPPKELPPPDQPKKEEPPKTESNKTDEPSAVKPKEASNGPVQSNPPKDENKGKKKDNAGGCKCAIY